MTSTGCRDCAQEAVRLIVWTGRKGHRAIRICTDSPQSVDYEVTAVGALKRAEERARVDVERVDLAVAEIADQQRTVQSAESRRRDRHSPRRVQRAIRNQSRPEISESIKNVNIT